MLSSVDLCEVARYSCLQSSFEPAVKAFWLGVLYHRGGTAGNDIHRTNVPYTRLRYREQTLHGERHTVLGATPLSSSTDQARARPPPAPKQLVPLATQPPALQSPHGLALALASPRRASKYERYDGPHSMLYVQSSSGALNQPSVARSLDSAAAEGGVGGVSGVSGVSARLDAQRALLVATQARAAKLDACATRAERESRAMMLVLLASAIAAAAVQWRARGR